MNQPLDDRNLNYAALMREVRDVIHNMRAATRMPASAFQRTSDLTQETVLKVFAKKFDPKLHELGYPPAETLLSNPEHEEGRKVLLRLCLLAARRQMISHARKRGAGKHGAAFKREEFEALLEMDLESARAERPEAQVELEDLLDQMQQSLGERVREVIELRQTGLNDEEIGVLYGISGEAIRQDRVKARNWLREPLAS